MAKRTDKRPDWLASYPDAEWGIESTTELGGWQLVARWAGRSGDTHVGGPREVVIRPTKSADLDRGITAGIMRDLVPLLGELAATLQETPSERAWHDGLAKQARDLPDVRDPAHWPALLNLYEIIAAVSAEPINDLARALGVPKQTAKSRLRIARQRTK